LTDSAAFYALGIALIFAGILMIVVAIILLSISSGKKAGAKGGGVILIGPIPIIFGTDKNAFKTVLLLSLALTAILVVAMIMYYLFLR
jgi:uncharacterized protein (TIGR00304 family)